MSDQLVSEKIAKKNPPRWAWGSIRVGEFGVVYALLAIVLILTTVTATMGKPSYLSAVNISNILDQSALAMILVVFMTVVLISGNFDLSVESTAALAAVIVLLYVDTLGVFGAVCLAVLVGALVGLFNGVMVEYVGINAFIVTLGTMTGVRGLVLMLADGNAVSPKNPESTQALYQISAGFWGINLLLILGIVMLLIAALSFFLGRRHQRTDSQPREGKMRVTDRRAIVYGVVGCVLIVLGIVAGPFIWTPRTWYAILIALSVWAVLRFTIMGRRVYAVGGNSEAARLSGIRVARYRVVPFVLSGAASGFVGVLFASQLGAANPSALSGLTLTVLAAAILGGTSLFGGSGNVLLSVVGVLLLYTIANGFNVLNLGSNYQALIQGAILILAAAVYTVGKRRESRRMAVKEK